MEGHWLLLLIVKLVLCFLGAAAILIYAAAVGLLDYRPPEPEEPWMKRGR